MLLIFSMPVLAEYEKAADLVVMIESVILGRVQHGAGIIYSIESDHYIIVTANHLVRTYGRNQLTANVVDVIFHAMPEKRFQAEIMNYYSRELDIAVLRVSKNVVPTEIGSKVPFSFLRKGPSLTRGDAVYPIGYPQGYPWASPIEAGRFDRKIDGDICFQSAFVTKRYSGGGVFNHNWILIGMVVSATNAPIVKALAIDTLNGQMQTWGFQKGISNKKTTNPSLTDDINLVLSTWGNLSAYYRNSLINLHIKNISNLPPIPDGIGQPEFGLEVAQPDGNKFVLEISEDEDITSYSQYIKNAKTLNLRVVEIDWLRNDIVTMQTMIGIDQLLQGHYFRMELDNSAKASLSINDRKKLVRLFVKAIYHDPEGHSGPDKDVAGAKHVKLNKLYSDSVDFENGDATDHILLNPERGVCSVMLLAGYNQEVNILYTKRDDNQVGVDETIYIEKYRVRETKEEEEKKEKILLEKLSLFKVNCSDKPMNLQIQAYRPEMRAEYSLYPEGLKLKVDDVYKLLKQVLGTRENQVPDEYSVIPASLLRILQRHTDTETSVMINGFEKYIKESWPKHAPLVVLDELFEDYTPVLATCCATAKTMRLINEVQKAERNMPYDKELVWALHTFIPYNIEQRIERLKQASETSTESTATGDALK